MRHLVRAAFVPLGVVAVLALLVMPAGARAATQVVTVDGQSSGRTFDGLGALSAGASSALLRDYPARQRSQILDYLFKPDYGASLQILKVEIGGDTNSTAGTEESHEREPGQIDCNRGYEWWLMEQAKLRNPHMKLYALQWGAPAWVGNGANTLFTDQDIQYLLDWLGCARQHGLTINYLGGWNEKGFNAGWYVDLRQALDANGYSGVQIVAADEATAWTVAPALASNPAFDAAVSIDGQHDPCGIRDATEVGVCPSTATAQSLGKPLWNSEQGAQVYNVNTPNLAQEINRDYIDGKMTGMIAYSLIWSAYSSLPLQGTGLMLANTPWSGNYTAANTMIWAMAHTTQFAKPGWQYLDSGSEALSNGGSVVSLRSPNGNQWSSIVETGEATAPETLTYQVQGGLSAGTVHVWATNTNSTDPDQWFQHVADVQPQDGSFPLTVQPGFIYSLTTTVGQHKGTAQPPPAHGWRLPYSDNFNSYPAGVMPRLFSTVGGAFDTARCIGRRGMCLEQQLTEQPVLWNNISNYPLTVVGDPDSWGNYRVSADALLEQPGYVELDSRSPSTQGRTAGFFNSSPGYHFRIDNNGNWSIYKQPVVPLGVSVASTTVTLASGVAPRGFGVDTWHRLGLETRGDEITATLDGRPLATVVDSTYQLGQVALETSPWAKAQFDNLDVEPVPVQGQGPQLGAVTPNTVQVAPTAAPLEVSATVTNPGKLNATEVAAQVQLPAGWTATPTTPAPTQLAPGASAPLAWQISAPESTPSGQDQATIEVTYKEGGLNWVATASVQFLTPFPTLAAAFNNVGITDDSDPSAGNIDNGGDSYSAESLQPSGLSPGASVTVQGITYTWPDVPAGQPDNVAADGQTIALTGSGAELGFLGGAYDGQQSGTGTITYSDGSTQTYTVTVARWFADNPSGTPDQLAGSGIVNGPSAGQHVGVYAFEVPLEAGKTVASVTLPNNGAIHFFAVAIDSGQALTSFPTVAAAFNNVGITDDSDPSAGNIDNGGDSYSAESLQPSGLSPGASVTVQGITYTWPDVPAGQPDNVAADGQTIQLTGAGTMLGFLGMAYDGQQSGTGTITYSDGSTQTYTITVAKWFADDPSGTPDQLVASGIVNGPDAGQHVGVYAIEVPLQAGKTVASITLPNNVQIHVFAVAIV